MKSMAPDAMSNGTSKVWAAAVRLSEPKAEPNSVLRDCADTEECAHCSIDAANQAGRQELGFPLRR